MKKFRIKYVQKIKTFRINIVSENRAVYKAITTNRAKPDVPAVMLCAGTCAAVILTTMYKHNFKQLLKV
jgi:redox-regulated HSP33 family molecular chaperone